MAIFQLLLELLNEIYAQRVLGRLEGAVGEHTRHGRDPHWRAEKASSLHSTPISHCVHTCDNCHYIQYKNSAGGKVRLGHDVPQRFLSGVNGQATLETAGLPAQGPRPTRPWRIQALRPASAGAGQPLNPKTLPCAAPRSAPCCNACATPFPC